MQGINKTGFHTGNVTISTDKNTLYYTRCTLNGNALSHCDIFQSKGSDGNWNEGTIITGINGSDFTVKHPAYGKKNGKDGLYFASNQAGGQGGWDLYFAPKLADGSFGQSENLGNKINTIGNEETPFYKNGVLHFSSDGHPTIGGYDVFEASETGSGFTNPKNMGVGVNSYVNDMYYTVSEDNWRGFLVSNGPGTTSLKSETCCDDIFAVKLPFTSDINVTTFDAEKQNPLSGVTVKLIELTGKYRPKQSQPYG